MYVKASVLVVEPAVTSVVELEIVPVPSAALIVTVGDPAVSAVNVAPIEPSNAAQAVAAPNAGTGKGPYVIVTVSPAAMVSALKLICWPENAINPDAVPEKTAEVLSPVGGVHPAGAVRRSTPPSVPPVAAVYVKTRVWVAPAETLDRSTVIVPEPLGA